MNIALFSTKSYDRRFLADANRGHGHALEFFDERLTIQTAKLAENAEAVCAFVNDGCDQAVLRALHKQGCRLIALRCAGFNNVDLAVARELGVKVARVPAYSPHAVAEHTLALILTLNRKTHRAFNRVREGNFSLDGLLGFELHGKTVGIVGTGRIGLVLAKTLAAMGSRLLGHDTFQSPRFTDLGGAYVELPNLLQESDIISLHCPLAPNTYRMIDARAIDLMKPGVMLINTSRGGLIDTEAVITGLKQQKIGYLGLDVYEQEADLFFENLSDTIIQDDYFQRLLTFPNVLVTGHQAYFTDTALRNIAETTIANISAFASGKVLENEVILDHVQRTA